MNPESPPPTTAPNGASRKKKLHVILHGLIMFYEDEHEITAFIPNMGPEHLYRAGTWLAETAIDEHADLRLETGGAEPNRNNTLVPADNFFVERVRPCTCGCENHTIYATLHLPYPSEPIRSLGPLEIPKSSLDGRDVDKVIGTQSANVQVLTYEYQDDTKIRLGNHPWEPVVELDTDGTTHVNLHIFSEPERSPNEDHVRHAFQASVSVFAGLNLMLVRPGKPGFVEIADPRIPGVVKEELEGLIQRRRRLDTLGRAIRDGRDLNTVWLQPLPFYSGDPSCSGSGGGKG